MPELTEKSLPPVFAAMAALDEAVAAHNVLVERLAGAVEEGTRLDEQLRRIDSADHEKLVGAAQALAFAVALVQSIARREERARVGMYRAQAALAETRRAQNRARLEELRIELEIDAASIWDLVGRFEAEVRARLEEHAKLAAEMHFVASAAGKPESAAPAAAMLTPALGTSGPDLWNALAGGVRQLYDRHGSPLPGHAAARPALAAAERFDFARPAVVAEKIDPPASAVPVRAAPQFDFARPTVVAEKVDPPALAIPVRAAPRAPVAPEPDPRAASRAASADLRQQSSVAGRPSPIEPENRRGRLDRILRDLAGMVSSKPAKKRSR